MGSASDMSTPSASAFLRDGGKKKRTNRSAKLKQCKLDARREQWLSQVKNKGDKESTNECSTPPLPSPLNAGQRDNDTLNHTGSRPRLERNNEGSALHDSDSLARGRASCPEKEPHASSGSSSSGSYSGTVSEEEDDSLDDWEAIADALDSETPTEPEPSPGPASLPKHPALPPRNRAPLEMIPKPAANPRAWRPDDAFRPQSLPNLSKQLSFSSNSDRHFGHATGNWASVGIISQPSSCPICYEDLDFTDSSFLPCSCGFRLCLFCHKRILEADGRCPGCRSPYRPVEGEVAVNVAPSHCRLLRSCSMSTRY